MVQSIKDIASGQSAPTQGSYRVYYGKYQAGYDPIRDALIPSKTGVKVITKSVDESIADWYSWSSAERNSWAERAFKLGLLRNPDDYGGAYKLWEMAVTEAARFYSLGKKEVTPWQMLDVIAGSHGSGGGGPRTSTSTSFQIPSAQEAEAAVKTIFQGALGRDPSDGELSRYSSVLISKAKANPRKTVTRTTTDTAGNTASTSTTSGGIDAGTTLKDEVQKTDEYGAYQAATTYMNALLAAIGSP